MLRRTKRTLNGISCVILLAICLAILASPLAKAEEPAAQATIQVGVESVGLPILSHLPHIGKLFKNVTVDIVKCESAAGCCPEGCCPESTPAGVWHPGAETLVCEEPLGGVEFIVCRHEEEEQEVAGFSNQELLVSLIDALTTGAALEARLEEREESAEQKQELFEAVVAATVENVRHEAETAQLAAQLEIQEQLADVLVENARLHAELELAAQRQQLVEQCAKAMIENEKLKLQIAKLEAHGKKAALAKTTTKPKSKTAKTAKHPNAKSRR